MFEKMRVRPDNPQNVQTKTHTFRDKYHNLETAYHKCPSGLVEVRNPAEAMSSSTRNGQPVRASC